MAYRLYQTEGIVLGTRLRGEASLLVDVLTPDLGLVTAIAQGVRKVTSKLRGHIGYGSVVRVSLVRGKEYWRLVSAERLLVAERAELLTKLRAFGRVLSLAQRLVHGEAPLEAAYYDLKDGWNLVLTSPLSSEELNNYSLLAGARLLAALGYLKRPELELPWTRESLALPSPVRADLVTEVTNALAASHL